MIDLIVWVITGALMGWLVSMLLQTREGPRLNIAVGIAGACLGGFVLNRLFGTSMPDQAGFSLPAVMASLMVPLPGAILLLAVVGVSRRLALRWHHYLIPGWLPSTPSLTR
jgi:uncharacterized membrane protein YeaQ/YmgE (transglycosylase-associated protein family)